MPPLSIVDMPLPFSGGDHLLSFAVVPIVRSWCVGKMMHMPIHGHEDAHTSQVCTHLSAFLSMLRLRALLVSSAVSRLHVEHEHRQSKKEKEHHQATSCWDSRLGHINLGEGKLTQHDHLPVIGQQHLLISTSHPHHPTVSQRTSMTTTPH